MSELSAEELETLNTLRHDISVALPGLHYMEVDAIAEHLFLCGWHQ